MRTLTSAKEVAQEFLRRGLPPNFCHVPFASLIFEPDGRVTCCRMKGTEFAVGDLKSQSVAKIWNGPVLREWRRQLLSGAPAFCRDELRLDRCHVCPEYNSLLSEISPREFQETPPLRITLNLNSRCNLKCRMCDIHLGPNELYKTQGWFEQILPFADRARELELLSGEPFIQKETYEWIDRLSRTNPNCLWSITTNGHWKLTEKIRAQLDRILVKHLIISIDSLDPKTYSMIRRGGNLGIVLGNLDALLAYDNDRKRRGLGSLNLHAAFLIQKDNWRELGAIHEFGLEKGITVFRSLLREPKEYSLLGLPRQELEDILETLLKELAPSQLLHARKVVLPILDGLDKVTKSHYLLELQAKLRGTAARQSDLACAPESVHYFPYK